MRFTLLLPLILVSFVRISFGQITPDYIETKIAQDSSYPAEGYQEYSEGLARTLGRLTSEQLARVFQENVNISVPTLNEELDLEPIRFGNFSSNLDPDSKVELDKVVLHLQGNPDMTITIEGHSSSGGNNNLQLSFDRAEAAQNYLISQGVDPSRIEHQGFGFTQPLDGLDPSDSQNQRIEIIPQ